MARACFAAGALKGAVAGAVSGAVEGAITGAVTHRVTTGSWQGATKAALDSAADGFMKGAMIGSITDGMTSKACFIAGTLVLTANGHKAIETIRAGDHVWAHDPETGETTLKKVVQTFVNETSELVHVWVNGKEIVTTPEHPFYVAQQGWTGAIELRAGDILVLVNGEYAIVELIQHELLESPIKVYNFEVEGFHTYFGGDDDVLVHNLCRQTAVRRAWKKERELVAKTGKGTRNWNSKQKLELLTRGKVKGYEGHHIKSVSSGYDPGDYTNIQFLTRKEHLAAHGGNWRYRTYTRYTRRQRNIRF